MRKYKYTKETLDVGQVGGNGHLGVALLEPYQHGVDQLVQHGGGLLHGYLPAVKAGDGQQVLHHPVQPLGTECVPPQMGC